MKKWVVFGGLSLCTGLAQAHTGHGAMSFFDGLAHPFGWDHLLAMVAVGLWSARGFIGVARWIAPLTFVLCLVLGACLTRMSSFEWAAAEWLISLGVVVFSIILAFPKIPKFWGLMLIGCAGIAHGWVHGLEAAEGSVFAIYVLGFVLTSSLLHGVGVYFGSRLLSAQLWVWRMLAVAMGSCGMWFLSTM